MRKMNLLPHGKQQELYYEQLLHSVSVAAVLAVAILLLGIVAQLATRVYLSRVQVSVAAEIESLKQATDKAENAELKQKIRTINSQMQDFETLAAQTPQWSKVLHAFARQVPVGIKIERLTADAKTGEIEVSGFSPSRELVIELYNNINADKNNFKDINYPLENVAKPVDVQFSYSFFIQDGVLIPKP